MGLSNCFCLDYRLAQMTVGLVPPVCLNLSNVHTHSHYPDHLIVTLKGLICLARKLDYKLFRNYGKSHIKETHPCAFLKHILLEHCVCACVHACACVYACVCACIHVCACVRVCVRTIMPAWPGRCVVIRNNKWLSKSLTPH